MRNIYWIGIGGVAGLASGALFGFDYALVGLVMGLIAGAGVAFTLRARR